MHTQQSRIYANIASGLSLANAVAQHREMVFRSRMNEPDVAQRRAALQLFFERSLKPRGWTINAWAIKAGVSESTVREFLAGKAKKRGMTDVVLRKLANAAGVSVAHLLGEDLAGASANELRILAAYRSSDEATRRAIEALVELAERLDATKSQT